MSSIDDHHSGVSLRWRTATALLTKEFAIPPERLHLIDTIRKLFDKYVSENNLSETAAIALYYRLSFFSILMTVRTLNKMDMQIPEFRLSDIMAIYADSKRLSSEADDCMVLEECIASINDSIEALIQDYR